MPKKKLLSRLENLFIGLDEIEPLQPVLKAEVVPGWTWECDLQGKITACSGDIKAHLDIEPEELLDHSIYQNLEPDSAQKLSQLFAQNSFPAEMETRFYNGEKCLNVRMTIFARESEGKLIGWHGFTQMLEEVSTRVPPVKRSPGVTTRLELPTVPKPITPAKPMSGVTIEAGKKEQATRPWTKYAKQLLTKPSLSVTQAAETDKNSIVTSLPLGKDQVGILEIISESETRKWSEEDRFLVQEVADQLLLALENARLYAAVQQELSERVKAEQEILERNRDLATLNQIGQQLSKLTNREDIFDVLKESIIKIVRCENLSIFTRHSTGEYEVQVTTTGEKLKPSEIEYITPILHAIAENPRPQILIGEQLTEIIKPHLGKKSSPIKAVLTVPMIAGEHELATIILQDTENENAFSPLHLELVSTIAAHATTALENANLFQEIRTALRAIENRERYQANAAKAVAVLTEFGTKALADVLTALGEGAQAGRVFFAQIRDDEQGVYWQPLAQWTHPEFQAAFSDIPLQSIPTSRHNRWITELKENGWCFDAGDKVNTLMISIPGKGKIPSFIGFEETRLDRKWQPDEINILRVAADAFSNTIVREDLLDQLQSSLDETENLYNASHRLALANDLQEMVNAITVGLPSPGLTSAVLLLNEFDSRNQITSIRVTANWYSGRGTPPAVLGMEYPRAVFDRLIFTPNPIFHDDINDLQLDNTLRDTLTQQNIRSLAVLPLWASKRQLGTLLLQYEDRHHFTGREIRSFPPLVDQMAISVENSRLFQQTEKALAETELLYQISSSIAQAADNRALISLVGKLILPKNADSAMLLEVTQYAGNEPSEMEVFSLHEVSTRADRGNTRLSINSLPFIRDLSNEIMVFPDIVKSSLDNTSKKTLQQMGIHAASIVPLLSGTQLLGLIFATSRRPAEFSSDEIRLLQVAGNGISVALERQRLLREAQRRALELETAAEIARDTTSTLSSDILLSRIVNLIFQRFNYYHAAIFLTDEYNEYASIQEAAGVAADEIKKVGVRIPVASASVIGTAISQGSPVVVNDITQSQIYIANPFLPDTRSELGIPLKSGYRVIGALDLQSNQPNEFSPEVISVLQILADQIAVAIENARAYELSQKAYEDMKEVERLKSQFLANMSHELRTPLNSIIGFSRVILKGIDGPINDTQKQDLTAIYTSGQHLLNLINEVLDLSKIEAGKMTLAIEDVNMVDLINSVMSTATGLVKDKPITLNQYIPDVLPVVKADPTRIRQVLINFISNAAKFTEEGFITVEAKEVISPAGKPEVMVTVTDTGPGIAQEDIAKLFQPFSQVDDSPTRKTGGTGLGLSISKSLIELHRGRIGLAKTELGVGSSFFFTLPIPEEEKQPETPAVLGQDKIVLSIEDDEQVASLYERYLAPQGYKVIPLTEPEKAVSRAKEIKPFAITLDIMMPGMDGWTVLLNLKNDPETKSIPVIVCSILDEEEKGISLGASDYLVKPFMQEELVNAINAMNTDGSIRKILVVDDDPEDLRLVEKMLTDSGNFQISLAEGGFAGWDILQKNPPDAVILDLFMPDMNGFDILERIKADANLSKIPVVILTGADLSSEQQNELAIFGQHLMAKGYLTEKDLLRSLEDALKKIPR